jgi:hypothetical protein
MQKPLSSWKSAGSPTNGKISGQTSIPRNTKGADFDALFVPLVSIRMNRTHPGGISPGFGNILQNETFPPDVPVRRLSLQVSLASRAPRLRRCGVDHRNSRVKGHIARLALHTGDGGEPLPQARGSGAGGCTGAPSGQVKSAYNRPDACSIDRSGTTDL